MVYNIVDCVFVIVVIVKMFWMLVVVLFVGWFEICDVLIVFVEVDECDVVLLNDLVFVCIGLLVRGVEWV